jgi:hypothetical protein
MGENKNSLSTQTQLISCQTKTKCFNLDLEISPIKVFLIFKICFRSLLGCHYETEDEEIHIFREKNVIELIHSGDQSLQKNADS